MGADPQKRKEIESEIEALRIINNIQDPLRQTIEKQAKSLEEKDKTIEEQAKSLEEKNKTIEETNKKLEEMNQRIAGLEHFLRDRKIE
jgi:methyl-accepting chemotaxis protein